MSLDNNKLMQAFDWDDEIEEEQEVIVFETMPAGDYEFEITNFTQGWYEASANSKIPSCAQAEYELTIKWINKDGYNRVNKLVYKMKLNKALTFVIYRFFNGIGLHKHGDGMKKFPWKNALNCKGIAKIKQYTSNKNGNVYNDVELIYPSEAKPNVTINDQTKIKINTPEKQDNFNIKAKDTIGDLGDVWNNSSDNIATATNKEVVDIPF